MRINSNDLFLYFYFNIHLIFHQWSWKSFTSHSLLFFNIIFVLSHMYPENPEGIQVFVSSMNMGYISDTASESNSQPVPFQAGADTTMSQAHGSYIAKQFNTLLFLHQKCSLFFQVCQEMLPLFSPRNFD